MNKINYQVKMEDIIKEYGGLGKKVLLQVCCGPCSSEVIERLRDHFDLDLYFYNPMIYPRSEFDKRAENVIKVKESLDLKADVIVPENNPKDFHEVALKRKDDVERGPACYDCYELRMRDTAKYAKENGYDFFTTSLSISPYKNAQWINEIGKKLEKEYGVAYLYSDFKKKNGYKNSIDLSKKYGIYRQDYCGCIFSLKERDKSEESC